MVEPFILLVVHYYKFICIFKYFSARRREAAEEAVKNTGMKNSEILAHQLDITQEGSCRVFAEHLKTKHGGFDVLVNNAGVAFSVKICI